MSIYSLYLISPLITKILLNIFYRMKEYYIYIIGLIFFSLFAFRSQYVGSGDAQFYFKLWEYCSTVSLSDIANIFQFDIEPGFLFVVWIGSQIFEDGQFIFVLSGAFFSFALCRFIMKYCNNSMLGFMVITSFGILSFFLQGLRQSVAICICLFAIDYCKNRDFFRFFSIVILASLFHASALVFSINYLVYGLKINWKGYCVILGTILISPLILPFLTSTANFFMNEEYQAGATELTSGGVMTFIMYIGVMLISAVVYNIAKYYYEVDLSGRDVDFAYYFIMSLVAVYFFSMRFYYITVFERASYYFILFMIPLMCQTIEFFKKCDVDRVRFIILITLTVLALYKNNPASVLYSYSFFWDNI